MNSDDFSSIIDNTSGLIYEEFDHLNRLFRQRPDLINQQLTSQLRRKFKSILHIIKDEFEELSNFVPPPRPDAFNEQWNIDQVVDWAVKKYLPYKFWLETIRDDDVDIYREGSKFADFVLANYTQFSYGYKNMISNFVFNFKGAITETGHPIIIILDNFNFKFLKYLKDSFAKYKFTLAENHPFLSLLPTMTSIAKMSIISGKRETIEPKTQKYEQKLQETWQPYFPNHTITYLSRPGDLSDYKVAGDELILVNYTQIDKELHESFEKTAIDHKKQVHFLLDSLTQLITNFVKKNRIESDCKVFFISDHGSTLLTKRMPNKLDIPYFNDKNIDHSHRYVRLKDREFQNFSSDPNIEDSVFLLEKQFSGDGHNYLIARAFNRFKDIADTFYVHGGALPEEMIVPGGYFEYQSVGTKDLILQLLSNEFRAQAKETLRLRIANPNIVIYRDIVINVSANDLPLKEITIPELTENDEMKIEEEIRIPGKDICTLKIHLMYTVNNQIYRQTFEFPVSIKAMAETTFDINSLLESE